MATDETVAAVLGMMACAYPGLSRKLDDPMTFRVWRDAFSDARDSLLVRAARIVARSSDWPSIAAVAREYGLLAGEEAERRADEEQRKALAPPDDCIAFADLPADMQERLRGFTGAGDE